MNKITNRILIKRINYFFMFICFMFIVGDVIGQTTIFSENMGTPSGTTAISSNIFQNSGTLTYSNGGQTNNSDIRATSPSSVYTGASGSGNVFFTSTNGSYGFSIESINASYYTSLKLTFGYRKESSTAHASFSVDYYDGSQWVSVANTATSLFNESTSASAGWYISKELTLPNTASINGLKIRFVKSGSNAIRIDDVKLSGFFNNSWTGTTDNNWNTGSNWSAGQMPNTTDNVLINTGSPILNIDYEISSGKNLTISGSGTLTINPGKKLTVTGTADFGGKSVTVASDATGSGAIVLNGGTLSNATNVTLQQYFNGQRAWRVLSNPFNSTLTPSTISSSNGSNSGSSAISVNQNGANDVVQYNSGNDQWSLSNSISANTCYAFFYKGLLGDFNGTPSINNYGAGGGPSATVYSVNGTLNYSDVNFTPTNATPNFTLIGNPFAAPINSQALTGNTSLPYYYYNPVSGSSAPNIKSGAWLVASTNSSTSTTIPMMGAIAYQATSTGTFTISKNSINTAGTLNTSLFKTTSGIKNLEINLIRNSNLHDRLIIREDDAAISNSIDAMDLNKLENPISNLYSITPNNQHLAVNTEYQFTQAIPLGINAPFGQYEFKVGANSFSNTDMVLIDHYLNQQQVLHNGASYNFEVTADSNTKGEHRFEIAKQAWATNIATSTTMEGLQILNNVVVDQITLFAAPQKQAMHYVLLDINAALIDKGNLIPGENHISTQTLAQGLYLLHVTSENAHIVYKIIKQ